LKFFVPGSAAPDAEQEMYDGIKAFLRLGHDAEVSDRRIRQLRWWREGTRYAAEVGVPTSFNGEEVIAIFFEGARNVYHVCTVNRGVLQGASILVGAGSVSSFEDFE